MAAIKVLLNPELAPYEMKERFSRLSVAVDRKTISECEATIAPSRDAATKLILEKHTQMSVLKWSPLMQAEFYRRLIQRGASVEEISGLYNLPASDVQSFLHMSHMYDLAASMDLQPNVKKKVLDPQNFPISTLERLYDSKETRR